MRLSEQDVQDLVSRYQKRAIEFIESGDTPKKRKISKKVRQSVNRSIGSKCPTCELIMTIPNPPSKKKYEPIPSSITIEHILPLSLGGDNTEINLVAMCHACNTRSRNTVQNKFIDARINGARGGKLTDVFKEIIERFVEWSVRSIYTPNSNLDAEIQEFFLETRNSIDESPTSIEELREILRQQDIRIKDLEARIDQIGESIIARFIRFAKKSLNRFRVTVRELLKNKNYPSIYSTEKLLDAPKKLVLNRPNSDSKQQFVEENPIEESRVLVVTDEQLVDSLKGKLVSEFGKSRDDPQRISFTRLSEIQKGVKEEFDCTWTRFYAAFQMPSQGSMSYKTKRVLNYLNFPHTVSKIDGMEYANLLPSFSKTVISVLGTEEIYISRTAFGTRLSKHIRENLGMERKEYLRALNLNTNLSLTKLIQQELGEKIVFSPDSRFIRYNRRN